MTPPIILALDTSGSRCDVAVVKGDEPLAQATWIERNAHSEKLIPLIEEALAASTLSRQKIDAVAISIGPGSFTGLRVGLSAAKGLALALDVPILGIPTHQAVAEMLPPLDRLWVTHTAKKDHFYWTEFTKKQAVRDCCVISVTSLLGRITGPLTIAADRPEWIFARLPSDLSSIITVLDETRAYPDARMVGKLAFGRLSRGESDNVASLVPLYVQAFQGVM